MKKLVVVFAVAVMFIALFANVVVAQESCTEENPCIEVPVRNHGAELVPSEGYSIGATKRDICVITNTESKGADGFFSIIFRDISSKTAGHEKDYTDVVFNVCVKKGGLQGVFYPLFIEGQEQDGSVGEIYGEFLGDGWTYFAHYLKEDGPAKSYLSPKIIENEIVTTKVKEINQLPYETPVSKLTFRKYVKDQSDADAVVQNDGFLKPSWKNGCLWKDTIYLKPSCSGGSKAVGLALITKPDKLMSDGFVVLEAGDGHYGLHFNIEIEKVVTKTQETIAPTAEVENPIPVIKGGGVLNTAGPVSQAATESQGDGASCSMDQQEIDNFAAAEARRHYEMMVSELQRRADENSKIEQIVAKGGIEVVVKAVERYSSNMGSTKTVIEERDTILKVLEPCPLTASESCDPNVEVEWKNGLYKPNFCSAIIRFKAGKKNTEVDYLNSWHERICGTGI